MTELPTYSDAPEPLTDRERRLINRIFSDYFEVPGEWKTALKMDLERDPPVLGPQTLGPTGGGGSLTPNSVTTAHIVDGTIIAADVNPIHQDGTASTPSLRTLGTGAQQAAAGNDSRFSAIGGDKNYVHNQVALSASWVVVHNLGKYVAVEVVDTGDSVIIPNIHFDSINQITLTFAAATSGKAYVN